MYVWISHAKFWIPLPIDNAATLYWPIPVDTLNVECVA